MAVLDHPSSDIGAVDVADGDHPAITVRRPGAGDDVLSDPIGQGKRRLASAAVSLPVARAKLRAFRRIDTFNPYTDAMDLDRIAIDDGRPTGDHLVGSCRQRHERGGERKEYGSGPHECIA